MNDDKDIVIDYDDECWNDERMNAYMHVCMKEWMSWIEWGQENDDEW